MILDEYIDVTIINNQMPYYRSKGYKFNKKGEVIRVKIEDMPHNSNRKIRVKCDLCGTEKIISIQNYYKSYDNQAYYCCADCARIKQNTIMRERYGTTIPYQVEAIKEKGKQTLLNHYGVTNPMYSDSIKKTLTESNQNKYGVSWVFQNETVKEKARQTTLTNWGVENSMQSPIVRKKARQTILNNFGVDNAMKSPEIRERAVKTLCENSNQQLSKQQEYLNNLFSQQYLSILNHPVKYYSLDIYLPDYLLDIEYNGGGHDLKVQLGALSKEDFIKKERKRSFVIASQGINQLTIISRKDYLPSDSTLLQMLEETLSYLSTTNHHWVEYDIDRSTVRNALGRFPYDFGVLRKIKKTDVQDINQDIPKEAS